MADEKKVYPKGIFVFPKRENSPKWLLGNMVINIEELMEWVKDNPDYITQYQNKNQLKLNVTEYEGRLSFSVDTFKPKAKDDIGYEGKAKDVPVKSKPVQKEVFNANPSNDLPFAILALFSLGMSMMF